MPEVRTLFFVMQGVKKGFLRPRAKKKAFYALGRKMAFFRPDTGVKNRHFRPSVTKKYLDGGKND